MLYRFFLALSLTAVVVAQPECSPTLPPASPKLTAESFQSMPKPKTNDLIAAIF
jgi:hypothetical protein